MIAHQYDEVDTQAIYNLYNKRNIFKLFLHEIKSHM